MRKSVVVVAVAAVLASCSPSHDDVRRWLNESFPVQYHEFNGEIVSVGFEDTRTGTTGRELRVPWGSFPWDDDEIQPTLTSAQRDLISSEIRKNFRGGDAINARVIVSRGGQRFVANWFSEEAQVEFSLTIEFVKADGDSGATRSVGTSQLTNKEFDVSLPLIQEMYLHAISKSVAECIRVYSTAARSGNGS